MALTLGSASLTLIGETLNYSIPRIRALYDEAAASGETIHLREIAQAQAARGADYLDVHVGPLPEPAFIRIIGDLQDSVPTPLCLDSPDPVKLEAGLRACRPVRPGGRPPILNSATEERAEKVFPLRRMAESQVVLLVSERMEGGIRRPNTTSRDFCRTAKQLVGRALDFGYPPGHIFLDPGMPCLGSDTTGMINTILDVLEEWNEDSGLVGIHRLVGLSNLAYGLPRRAARPLENAFLTLSSARGLDTIIGNPAAEYRLLDNVDPYLKGLKEILSVNGLNRLRILRSLYRA